MSAHIVLAEAELDEATSPDGRRMRSVCVTQRMIEVSAMALRSGCQCTRRRWCPPLVAAGHAPNGRKAPRRRNPACINLHELTRASGLGSMLVSSLGLSMASLLRIGGGVDFSRPNMTALLHPSRAGECHWTGTATLRGHLHRLPTRIQVLHATATSPPSS